MKKKERPWSKDEWRILYYHLYKNNFKKFDQSKILEVSNIIKNYLEVFSLDNSRSNKERNITGITFQSNNFLNYYKIYEEGKLSSLAMNICERYRNNFKELENEVKKIEFQINYSLWTGLDTKQFEILIIPISRLNLKRTLLSFLYKNDIQYIFELLKIKNIDFYEKAIIDESLSIFSDFLEVGVDIYDNSFVKNLNKITKIDNQKLSNTITLEQEKFFSSRINEVDIDDNIIKALTDFGYVYIFEIATLVDTDLLAIPRFGRKKLSILNKFLDENRLGLSNKDILRKISDHNINEIRKKHDYKKLRRIAIIHLDRPNISDGLIVDIDSKHKYIIDVWRNGKRVETLKSKDFLYIISKEIGGGFSAKYKNKFYKTKIL